MQCTKCNKGTTIKVTTQNRAHGKHTERRGLLVWIITLPWRVIRWIFRFGVKSQKETFHKETVWRCNYCGETWKDEQAKQEIPAEEVKKIESPEVDKEQEDI